MTKQERMKRYLYTGAIIVVIMITFFFGGKYIYAMQKESRKIVSKPKEEALVLENNDVDKTVNQMEKTEKNDPETKEENNFTDSIKIDVKGEVVNPGVHLLKEGQRVLDAIQVAGGLTENADTSVINLSKRLFDEMVVVIYSKDQVNNILKVLEEEQKIIETCPNLLNATYQNDACRKTEEKEEIQTETKKISINSATLEELLNLNGIGENKAKNIIAYRTEHGAFTSIEQLMEVDGIGESIFVKIKDNLTL